jgi:hypothetical protein
VLLTVQKAATSAPDVVGHEAALRFARLLRDDVDDAVDRVRAPERCAWAADDLDPVDVFDHRVLHVPLDARIDRRIERSAIHQHEELVRVLVVESADADGPLPRRLSRDLDARQGSRGAGEQVSR